MGKNPKKLKMKYWVAYAVILVGLFFVIRQSSAVTDIRLYPNTNGAEYVGMETCVTCHEDEHREYQLSSHARIEIKTDDGTLVQGCETCHGPGSMHVDAGGGKGTMIKADKNPQMCFSCHSDKEMEFRLPYRHPVLEGKMSCTDCHNIHGSDKNPWTLTSLDGTSGVCFNCHKEQRGPFVYEHEAMREGCTNCHNVHGAINDKMLIVRDNNLCFKCHSQADMSVTIGDSDHSGRLDEGTCFSGGCHTAVHGSNFNDHLRY
ncbi:MAG: hypothetical protein KC713_04680 [Candidatus Omnitrophica bacterium]|nr:hypothetical protein [Candidatus Omnitrophota bacterium]